MVLPFSPRSRTQRAVLFIGPGSVDWFERGLDGEPRRARAEVPEPTTEVLVKAVSEVRRAAGSHAHGCVLAVAPPLAFHKLITLPALARKDLAQVFARRTRELAGDAGHVYYTAREMEREKAEKGEDLRTWLVAGVRAGVRELCLRLRDQALHVQRVVSSELAALESGRQQVADQAQAAIVIVVGETAVSVALTSGEVLAYQVSIEGDLSARPVLATGLVHEIRTCAAFWKKKSRGQVVTQVVVVGLPRSRVDLLAVTLASILPGATVRSLAEEGEDSGGRLSLLAASLATGPLNPDLTFLLPLRRRHVALCAALAAVAALGGVFLMFDAASKRVTEVREQAAKLRQGAADLEDLRARIDEARAHVERLESQVQRKQAIAGAGLPVERLLASVLGAFAGRADFEELGVQRPGDEPAEVTIEGRCQRDPAAMVVHLRQLLDELERDSLLRDLSLTLPVDFRDETSEDAAFTIEARLRS